MHSSINAYSNFKYLLYVEREKDNIQRVWTMMLSNGTLITFFNLNFKPFEQILVKKKIEVSRRILKRL